MLENIRDKYRADVSLVAIFQEETDPSGIREYLEQSGIRPDFVLHDPMLRQTRSYSLGYVPVLLVAGPDGTIVLSRKGYQPERSWYFSGELERFFVRRTARMEETPFTESGRIHGEALQYLSEGRPEMALMFLKRILELSPGLFTAHSLIAEAYGDLGRRQEAARHYGLYVAANPGAYDMPQVKEKLRVLAEANH
jgi:tetratricopeptide (TPR) repeat protein